MRAQRALLHRAVLTKRSPGSRSTAIDRTSSRTGASCRPQAATQPPQTQMRQPGTRQTRPSVAAAGADGAAANYGARS